MTQIEQIKAEIELRIKLYENSIGVVDVRIQDECKGMLKAYYDMLTFIDVFVSPLSIEQSENIGKLASQDDATMVKNILGTYKTLEDMLDLTTSQDRDILESMNFERDWLKRRFVSTANPELEKQLEKPVSELYKAMIAGCKKHNYTDNWETAAYKQGIVDGALWQKQKFEKERLSACEKMTEEEYRLETAFAEKFFKENESLPTYADAIKFGIEWQKQQMKKEAAEFLIRDIDEQNIELAFFPPRNLEIGREGDKVKLIILKEND